MRKAETTFLKKIGGLSLNLPSIIQAIYNTSEIVFTGLYSFEFVDKNNNTITEIFFMQPPKTKTVEEPTRSTTSPTLAGNYNNDAGNGTKNITLSGDLYFPDVGSPDNPIARDHDGLQNLRNGLDEFFCLRWFLIRYRDYTMTKNGKISDPGNILNNSPQVTKLFEEVGKRLKRRVGALYDEIRVIFHDYDMDDHWYCRVNNFSTSQSDQKYIAISYTINIECTEPNSKSMDSIQIKKNTNDQINVISNMFSEIDYDTAFSDIQSDIGFNSDLVSVLVGTGESVQSIIDEAEAIQAGTKTAFDDLPVYVKDLKMQVNSALNEFKDNFLSNDQRDLYNTGDLTLDEIINMDLVNFYNVLQKIKILNDSLSGVIKASSNLNTIRFGENSDTYRLTEEQFDSDNDKRITNDVSFYYYTVMDGDNSKIIAHRELNDQSKFIKILEINDITENDFIDGSLIGKQIKIPLLSEAIARGDDNLVYEVNPDDVAAYLYGKDIATGISKNILISGTGDIGEVAGAENVIGQIENRVTNRKGSLNVFNPGWGILSPDDGNAPLLVKIERYLNSIIEQIRKDPRVVSAQMDLGRLEYTGETISVPTKINLLNNESSEVQING